MYLIVVLDLIHIIRFLRYTKFGFEGRRHYQCLQVKDILSRFGSYCICAWDRYAYLTSGLVLQVKKYSSFC